MTFNTHSYITYDLMVKAGMLIKAGRREKYTAVSMIFPAEKQPTTLKSHWFGSTYLPIKFAFPSECDKYY